MERTRAAPLPALIASAVLGGALLVGCQAQPLRAFPQERYAIDNPYTDIDAFDTRGVRVDTEVPEQYPEGSTRVQAFLEARPSFAGERPYAVTYVESGENEGAAEHDAAILPDAVGTDAEQGEGEGEGEEEEEGR